MKGILALCAALAGLAAAVPLASGGTDPVTGTTSTTTTPKPCPPGHARVSRHRGQVRACGYRRAVRRRASKLAFRACRAERRDANFAAEHGGKTFAEFYGEHPIRACRRAKTQIVRNAAQACRAERQEGAEDFRNKYGTGPNKRNAFGKCVSQKAKAGGL